MTLRFFALFFIQAVGLKPTEVSLVGALSPLGVAAAALACQPLSKAVGRVQIRCATHIYVFGLEALLQAGVAAAVAYAGSRPDLTLRQRGAAFKPGSPLLTAPPEC